MNNIRCIYKSISARSLKKFQFRTCKVPSRRANKQTKLRRNVIFFFQKYLSLCTNCNGESWNLFILFH